MKLVVTNTGEVLGPLNGNNWRWAELTPSIRKEYTSLSDCPFRDVFWEMMVCKQYVRNSGSMIFQIQDMTL